MFVDSVKGLARERPPREVHGTREVGHVRNRALSPAEAWVRECLEALSGGRRARLYELLRARCAGAADGAPVPPGGAGPACGNGLAGTECDDEGIVPFARLRAIVERSIAAQFEVCEQAFGVGGSVSSPYAPVYRALLGRCGLVPPVLFALGYGGPLRDRRPWVAVVGTREPSRYGIAVAATMGRLAGERGIGIVSGLAVGIDIAAHRAVLEAGGAACAVLGSGFMSLYPPAHEEEARLVARSGSLVSEFMPYEPAVPRNFLLRNRIIACLSDAVVVVEARDRSGSLATAAYAADAGVPVWAVPGEVGKPRSEGTNRLLRDGAIPLVDVEEFFDWVASDCRARRED